MPRFQRIALVITVLVLVAAVLLACFYGSQLFQPTTEPISTSDLAALNYYTEQYPPYNYYENGTLKGVSIDLLGKITEKIGLKATDSQIHLASWTEGYQAAQTQNNTVLFSTVRLPEREDLFKWAGPICSYQYALFAGWDKAISINSASDLKSYRIGVITDDAAIEQLVAAGVERSKLVNETDASVLIQKLAHGDIDLWCYPQEVGGFLTEQVTGNYYAFKVVYRLDNIELYYAFSRDTPDSTVYAFQQTLDALKEEKDSTGFSIYDMILGQYIPSIGFAHLNYLTEEWAPFNYAKDGDAAGISVEILDAIFHNAGVDHTATKVKIMPLSEAFEQARGNTSTVLFSIVRTAQREPDYKWVGPFTKAGFVVYSAADRNITIASAQDLNKYRIGTVNATIEYDLLVAQNVAASNIVVASTPAELLQMLKDGQIDLWATGEFTGHYEVNNAGLDTKDFEVAYTLGEKEFYFIFSKDVPDSVVDAFGHALETVRNQKDAQGFSMYERIIYRNLGVGYAKQSFTNQQVMDLVDTTSTAIETNAADAFLHINAGDTPYRDPNRSGLYVFVYDTNVTMVAHADNIQLVGANFKGKTDVTGKPFRDCIIEGALQNGTGWVDYVYSNSAQTNLYYKTTYYRLVVGSDGNQYVVCSGNFKS